LTLFLVLKAGKADRFAGMLKACHHCGDFVYSTDKPSKNAPNFLVHHPVVVLPSFVCVRPEKKGDSPCTGGHISGFGI
jgi:hypothetical protein